MSVFLFSTVLIRLCRARARLYVSLFSMMAASAGDTEVYQNGVGVNSRNSHAAAAAACESIGVGAPWSILSTLPPFPPSLDVCGLLERCNK